jgi:superfamily I DNA/RNA helicase
VPKTLAVASELIAKYPAGTVAIITIEPGSIIEQLGRDGWRRRDSLGIWGKGSEELRLYTPQGARGLEFDAVVVMEPGAFPKNLGRSGQLYTSLTRANRELAVVWHTGMPDPLRRVTRR